MTLGPRLTATILTLSLVASSARANADILGVVTHARSANLGTGVVSPGASVCDGDYLSTEADGGLTLRSGGSLIHLGSDTRAMLRTVPGEVRVTQINLGAGTVVFSTPQSTTLEVDANEVHIRPATNASTLGQIAVTGPKTLELYARRGSLKISYRDETEIISEGDSYRMLLDPPDDSSAKTGGNQPAQDTKKHRKRKTFVLLLLGAAGGAAAVSPWLMPKDYESPDHP